MHRAAKQAGTVRRVVDAGNRLQPANEHRMRHASGGSHDVEAVPEAVDEVDICMTRRSEHDLGALGPAARGMCSQIPRALVGLGLDDPPDLPAGRAGVDQMHAEEVARDQERFAGIEGEGKSGGGGRHRGRTYIREEERKRRVGLQPDSYSAFGQCADTCITSNSAVPAAASSDFTLMRMKSSELPFSKK